MMTQWNGLDLLETAVVILNANTRIHYINNAAANLFSCSLKEVQNTALSHLFPTLPQLNKALQHTQLHNTSFNQYALEITLYNKQRIHVNLIATPLEDRAGGWILEFCIMDKQLKIANEERMLAQQQATKELIRNLAHEIKNPLGGIRGAAQLLEYELPSPALREYTQVIRDEVDRLQALLDRLLTPHRLPQITELNIHEVLERVRSLILAETQQGLIIQRDYDISLPLIKGDKSQLIQVILNIMRNAMQAMQQQGTIILRTRIQRQATIARARHALAAQIEIIDDGPGIPLELQDKIFYPLVSGRADGHGVGLTLAQNFIQQHRGHIEFESRAGHTNFTLLLPISTPKRD